MINCLGIKKEKIKTPVSGLNGLSQNIKWKLKTIIRNEDSSFAEPVDFLIVDKITEFTPSSSLDISKVEIPKFLTLADKSFYEANEVHALISADIFFKVLKQNTYKVNEELFFKESEFGWIACGKLEERQINKQGQCFLVKNDSIQDTLKLFFDLEGLGIRDDPVLHERDQAIEIFKETEFEKGHYIVQLPFRKSYNELSDSYPLAKQRFQNLWRRFGHDLELYQQYREIICDYTEQGIIEEAVRKDGRLTSKTRIVFDARSHQNNELSLNDCLWPGINLNPNLLDILINFRLNAIAFCSDIKQAFLQICLADEHKDAIRFLWSDDELCVHKRPKLQVYRFNRENFGVSSSPFLLAATIRHHIEKYKHEFPHTVELLDTNFYVDDLISGGNKFEEALQTSRRAKNTMEAAGMDLRKWITNDANLMEQWKKENFNVHPVHETVSLGANGTKVLGLSWNTNEDYLTTDTKSLLEFVSLDKNTKRFILQAVGKIFDPLGLISPFTVRMKCLLEDLWKEEIQWKRSGKNGPNRSPCAGKENPADFLSRGLSADCLVSNSRWWTGAEFLSDSEFPKNFQQVVPELDYLTEHEKETIVQERKKLPEADRSEETVLLNSDSSSIVDELLELSNNYFKVINILSYIFRFNFNCRNKSKKVRPLTVAKFNESEIKLIKHAQRSLFDKKEISSSISNFFPFVDGEGIVCVGGRLENASVPYLHKHPAILPKGSKLSKLYFNSLHTRLFHVGPQGLLNAVQQKFWPLSGRSIARKTVHQCVTCFKSRPILSSQIMGNLPSERVNISSPFTIAGLDLCGPFFSQI
ncbi:integrase catalytic domain-containing protein [Trichonephila clavipes]|nr:integrase catalytic domain-containing protein [Trichonephila clavipes]